jgi:2-polyprenyl-6-methoxyphenol hydroxylase-like FAD-dependent oxidoreductase
MLCDVAIVGAGPYGLAAASHLRKIKGLSVSIFGEPMQFWRTAMPAGPVEGGSIRMTLAALAPL